jgi:hypothetical protein
MLRFEPVALMKLRFVTVLDPALKLPERTRVVPVAFVNVVFWSVVTPETARAPERFNVVPDAFVKLNVVTVLEPALKAPVNESVVPEAFVYRSVARLEVPVTFKLPVPMLVAEVFARTVEPVAVRFEVVRPPKSVIVVVV